MPPKVSYLFSRRTLWAVFRLLECTAVQSSVSLALASPAASSIVLANITQSASAWLPLSANSFGSIGRLYCCSLPRLWTRCRRILPVAEWKAKSLFGEGLGLSGLHAPAIAKPASTSKLATHFEVDGGVVACALCKQVRH